MGRLAEREITDEEQRRVALEAVTEEVEVADAKQRDGARRGAPCGEELGTVHPIETLDARIGGPVRRRGIAEIMEGVAHVLLPDAGVAELRLFVAERERPRGVAASPEPDQSTADVVELPGRPLHHRDEREAELATVAHRKFVVVGQEDRALFRVEAVRERLPQGVDAASGPVARLEHGDLDTRASELVSSGESRQPSAHDDDASSRRSRARPDARPRRWRASGEGCQSHRAMTEEVASLHGLGAPATRRLPAQARPPFSYCFPRQALRRAQRICPASAFVKRASAATSYGSRRAARRRPATGLGVDGRHDLGFESASEGQRLAHTNGS